MGEGPLVTEQITAGAELARAFDAYAPLRAAFWVRPQSTGQWLLYLVSDRIDDSNFDLAYGEVIRLLDAKPQVWLDLHQVRVAGVDFPVAKGALALRAKYPRPGPLRLQDRSLGGGVFAEELYIYDLPQPAVA
jgi:hypothetical protein